MSNSIFKMTPQDPSNPKPPLHNFSLPYNLKWGHQRTLKCIKLATHNDHHHHQSTTDTAIAANVLDNGHTHDHQIQQKVSSFVEENGNLNSNANPNANANANGTNGNATHDESCSKPWNLRTRRAACKAPLKIEDKRNVFYSNNNDGVINSPRRRSLEIDSPRRNSCVVNVNEKLQFSVSLSKNEIEQDFFQIARIRPPRRPKKRPRIVQKYLDSVFPGLWLSEITPDSYKVPDVPES